MSELRAAFMRLRRSPGFAIGAALSLALGMSLATAVFGVVNSVLFKPLPFPEGDRIGYVYQTLPQVGWDLGNATPRMFRAMQTGATPAFQSVAGWTSSGVLLGTRDEQRYVYASRVTSEFHRVLRVRAALGRTFEDNDARAPTPPVILSHDLWDARFAADSTIVGREIVIAGGRHRVVGVMAKGFDFPVGTKAWFPLNEDSLAYESADSSASFQWLQTFGRLRPAATFEQASVEVAALYRRLYGNDVLRTTRSSRVATMGEHLLSRMKEALQLWIAAAILVALLCAVNFATMSMARGMRRRDEIAVRAALGATRMDLAKTLLVEATLLALLGGILAALFAWWLLGFALVWFAGGSLPVDVTMDWVSIAAGVVATVVVGFVFAAAPAIELAKVDLRSALQGAASATTSSRRDLTGRRALVALQLSLALTAVAVVTALIQADRRFQARAFGFDAEQVVVARLFSDSSGTTVPSDRVLERIQALQGVVSVASLGSTPSAIVWRDAEAIDGRFYYLRATPTLFRTLNVPLLAGRLPTDGEIRADADLMVASERMARLLAGSAEGAVGKRYRIKSLRQPMRWMTVVGVVPDYGGVWSVQLSAPLYALELPKPARSQGLLIRVSGDVTIRARDLGKLLARLDPHVTVSQSRPLQAIIDEQNGATRGRRIFLSAVALLAMILAVIGVYGLTSYTTELRLREFGIRVALGASVPRLARVVYGDLWWMSAIGIAAGAFASGRLVQFLDSLYRPMLMRGPLIVLPLVPTVVSATVLIVISVFGTAAPLRRVLRMDVIRAVQGSG